VDFYRQFAMLQHDVHRIADALDRIAPKPDPMAPPEDQP